MGAPTPPRLLDQVRQALRVRHYSPRTEEAYVSWVRRFILFHRKRHPRKMGAAEVTAYVSSLAVRDRMAASTQNQALSALLFLYKEVLHAPLPPIDVQVRARMPERLPVVLTRDEVRAVLRQLTGTSWLAAAILYGSGLRLSECLDLRVKDIDFERRGIVVRRGKGQKDRVTLLAGSLMDPLRAHLRSVCELHRKDASAVLWSAYQPSHCISDQPSGSRAC